MAGGFVEEIVALVQARAARAISMGDYEPLALAAHLFALCTYLREAGFSGRMQVAKAPLHGSSDEALAALVELRPVPEDVLYSRLRAALEAIDRDFSEAEGELLTLPRSTRLDPLPSIPGFFGEVRHWVRTASAWGQLRIDRRHAAPERATYPLWPMEYLQYLGMAWDRHEMPRIEVVPKLADLAESGFLLEEGKLRVALCPLSHLWGARFRIDESEPLFTVDRQRPVDDPAQAEAHLRALLSYAQMYQLHLLVLPELSVSDSMLDFLQQALARGEAPTLIGIIAGSFHFWRESGRSPVNEAAVLGRQAPSLWTHKKRGYFRLTAKQVRLAKQIFAPLPLEFAAEVVEDIQYGNELQVVDTPLGRLAIVICADAIDFRGGYVPAILRAQPDLLFMVSMSTRCEDFHRLAEELARLDISTLYVNAARVCPPGQELAFAYFGIAEPRGAPPTRLRWLSGSDQIEKADPRSGRPLEWEPLLKEDSSAMLLPDQCGLVLNLGEHWKFGPE